MWFRPSAPRAVPFKFRLRQAGVSDLSSTSGLQPACLWPELTEAERTELSSKMDKSSLAAAASQGFHRRADSLPAPRAEKVEVINPKEERVRAPETTSGRLSIVRQVPDNTTCEPIVSHLSVTFSHPVTAVGETRDIGAVVTPAVQGKTRWLGDRTLLFEPEYRFPQATKVTLRVPQGTTALCSSISPLESEFVVSFETPVCKLLRTFPYSRVTSLSPVFTLYFNAQVDPKRIAAISKLVVNGKEIRCTPLTREEAELFVSSQKGSSPLPVEEQGENIVYLKPELLLDPGSKYMFEILKAIPSTEGPLVETSPGYTQSEWETFSRLQKQSQWPEEGSEANRCRCVCVGFNNNIDQDLFNPAWVSISPPLNDALVEASDCRVTVSGSFKGKTLYTININGQLKDIYGQQLGEDVLSNFQIGPSFPSFEVCTGSDLVTLDLSVMSDAHHNDIRSTRRSTIVNGNKGDLKISVNQPVLSTDFIIAGRNLDSIEVSVFNPKASDVSKYWNSGREFENLNDWGNLIVEKAIIPGDVFVKEERNFIAIDVPYLLKDNGCHGNVILHITPHFPESKKTGGFGVGGNGGGCPLAYPRVCWVQSTSYAIDLWRSQKQGHALLSKLCDGSPVNGAQVEIRSDAGCRYQGETSDHGSAIFEITEEFDGYVYAKVGDEEVFTRTYQEYQPEGEGLVAHIFDDRKLYKPTEEVNIKGIIRSIESKGSGQKLEPVGEGTPVKYAVSDPRGTVIFERETRTNAFGSFHIAFTIPESTNLGTVSVVFTVGSQQFYHSLEIQEFRRPEFSTECQITTSKPAIFTTPLLSEAKASYFAGGPLTTANVDWSVTVEAFNYRPPKWDAFTFYDASEYYNVSKERKTQTGKLSNQGRDNICIDFDDSVEQQLKSAALVTIESRVTDLNYQSFTNSTTAVVHSSNIYVGLKAAKKSFGSVKTPSLVDVIVVDIDGTPQAGIQVEVSVQRSVVRKNGNARVTEWVDVPQVFGPLTSEGVPVTVSVHFVDDGVHRIVARIVDHRGLVNTGVLEHFVSGGGRRITSANDADTVVIIADKELYEVGDEAEIVIQSPWDAEAFSTAFVSTFGIVQKEEFSTAGPHIMKVKITESHIPRFQVQVVSNGQKDRPDELNLGGKITACVPAYASGEKSIAVSRLRRSLGVNLEPNSTSVTPGSTVAINIALNPLDGNMDDEDVELTLWAVDESVLSLTDYVFKNPLDFFLDSLSRTTVNIRNSRENLLLVDLKSISEEQIEPVQHFGGGGRMMMKCFAGAPECMMMDAGGSQPGLIGVRRNFQALAAFLPEIQVSVKGNVGTYAANVKFPDSLTRYRVMAVAQSRSSQRFGIGECSVEVIQPLMIRPSFPRFLNLGDNSGLSCVLQNNTDHSLSVNLVPLSSPVFVLSEASKRGYKVELRPRQRSEVRLNGIADAVGEAVIMVGVQGEVQGGNNTKFTDCVEQRIQILTPTTTESFAAYGEIEKDGGVIVQAVKIPQNVYKEFGGISFSSSSTLLSSLTDACGYIVQYKFDCVEQISSKLLTISVLKPFANDFGQLLSDPGLSATLVASLKTKCRDGAFGFWSYDTPNNFTTVHAFHALARARNAQSVDEELWWAVKNHVTDKITQKFSEVDWVYGRLHLMGLAIYALSIAGEGARTKEFLDLLFSEFEKEKVKPNLDLQALIISAICSARITDNQLLTSAKQYLKGFIARVIDSPSTASFCTEYEDRGKSMLVLLHSSVRSDAIILESLLWALETQIMEEEIRDLAPKVVRGLLNGRKRGRWSNTQENTWCSIALVKYYAIFESVTPKFTFQSWIGDCHVSSHSFEGRETVVRQSNISLNDVDHLQPLTRGENYIITVQKEGEGRLYYRLGLKVALKDEQIKNRFEGFTVQREYQGMKDSEGTVWKKNGKTHIKLGAKVLVRITIGVQDAKYHVALVDYLPAGLEPVNTNLKGQSSADIEDALANNQSWWSGRNTLGAWWAEHMNVRSERVEAFRTYLWSGEFSLQYVATATNTGEFNVPPAHAEEMYTPEVFGHTESEVVVIEP